LSTFHVGVMKKGMKKKIKPEAHSLFSGKDLQNMERLRLNLNDVKRQLTLHRKGPLFLKLNRPCTDHDGIVSFSSARRRELISFYERESCKYDIIKFVPASGAASRMFSEWFSASEKGGFGSKALDRLFVANLKKFPFFDLIRQNDPGRKLLAEKDVGRLLKFILSSGGMNFGKRPKALIPFHRYSAREIRTPLEEHVCEAALYTLNRGVCHIHFTLSPGYKSGVVRYLKKVIAGYEKRNRIRYNISLSVQSASTNTIAVDKNNLPFRDDQGRIVFRPGGHGALLKNLKHLDADFIFVRNIDNAAPETLWEKIIPHRKMLGGLAIRMQEEIFSHIRKLKNNKPDVSQIRNIANFCSEKLNIVFAEGFDRQPASEKIRTLLSCLNKPLRVCGMVRNENQPGGGPFWVEEKDGTQTLQIVESAHVDTKQTDQAAIWFGAEYFNPVDMVCCIRDYRGRVFDLSDYVNNDTYLITSKSEKGRQLKALELPGLWNGSMAYWNTVFVKLPIVVFNPVKTVYDLLRPGHSVR